LEELMRHEEETASAKKRYRQIFDEAEKLFAAKKYGEAQPKYLECLKEYRKGFEPDEKFIQKRHADTEKYEELSNLYKSGKAADEQGNYDLAAHYYQKANSIHKSPKLEALIKEASAKTKSGSTRRPPAKKQGSSIGRKILWGVLGAAAFFILLIVIFNEEFMEGFNEGYNESLTEQSLNNSNTDEILNAPITPQQTKKTKPAKKAINYARDIKGVWTCSNVQAELPDIPPLFLNVSYNFLDDIVYENAVPLSYFVNGNQLNVNNGVVSGTIRMPNKNKMVVTGNYNVQYVGSFPVTWTFNRN